VGIATMSFAVLPRRDINPDVTDSLDAGPTTMAEVDSRLRAPLADVLGIRVVDGAGGALEAPVTDWGRNSMGAMQGGVVAMLADFAAEQALRAESKTPVVVRDMQITYLGFGRVGPVRTSAVLLGEGAARVDIVDTGAEDRQMTTVSVRGA
jgi:acyl-coenzyme A thioesterase PaaI-like protein